MESKLICHVDMNSYFASVEQQANPFFRDRPLGVCAYLHPRGCVIAASVEAKKLGVKVGMTVMEAQRIVPGMIFVQNDPAKYRTVTSHIFTLLQGMSDRIEHYSIDEAFVDFTGWCRDAAEAAFIFSRFKERLRTEVGEWLRCSVGIGPTKFLAKFASDRRKPDGLVVIDQQNLVSWLHIPVQEAWGIGPRIKKRLAKLGITTLYDLYLYPSTNLMQVFGIQGFFLWCHVQGIECDGFAVPGASPKSIGHSFCVPRQISREGKIEAVLTKLTERVGRRLRSQGLLAGRIAVHIHCADEKRYRQICHIFSEPADHVFALVHAVVRLFQNMHITQEIDFISVTCLDLREPVDQLLFRLGVSQDRLMDQRLHSVSRSMDQIRDRHGEEAIVLGRMWGALGERSAPDRIGFRKVEGVAVSEFPAYDEQVIYDETECG